MNPLEINSHMRLNTDGNMIEQRLNESSLIRQ